MTKVTFYLFDTDSEMPAGTNEQAAHLRLACQLATQSFRNRQRCLILCEDKGSAESVDELLWQQPPDSFVPHNLTGEGPIGGAQVEIAWHVPTQHNRAVLINLQTNTPEFADRYQTIFDFVPAAEQLKQQARNRYKQYRAAGCQMDTLPATSIKES